MPRWSYLLVNVLHVYRRLIFDLARVSVIIESGSSERNRIQLEVFPLGAAINQDVVPINLQIGRDANAFGPPWQFPAEVSGDSARQTGGGSPVLGDADPCS